MCYLVYYVRDYQSCRLIFIDYCYLQLLYDNANRWKFVFGCIQEPKFAEVKKR